MSKIIFTIEGDHSDLEWVRTRIDGAILDHIEEAKEEGRIRRRDRLRLGVGVGGLT